MSDDKETGSSAPISARTASELQGALAILVAVARADDRVDDAEREAIAHVFTELDVGSTLERALAAPVDVANAIEAVKSREVREAVFQAAWLVAYADDRARPEEVRIIDALKEAWGLERMVPTPLQFAWSLKNTYYGDAIADDREREQAVKRSILFYSGLAAGFGVIPIPFFGEIPILVLQRRLIQKIAGLHGKLLDSKEMVALLGAIAGAAAFRIAVTSLMKLLPVWGSAVGSSTGFLSTYAIGAAIAKHFAEGSGAIDPRKLKDDIAAATEQGKAEWEARRDALSGPTKEHQARLRGLSEELRAGTLTEAEFDRRVEELQDS